MNYKDTNKREQCKIYFDIAENSFHRYNNPKQKWCAGLYIF